MTSTLLAPPPETAAPPEPTDHGSPTVSLEDRVPPHLQFTRRLAATLFGFGLIYAWFTLKPLWHTDLWGHLAYGRELLQRGELPTTEPLMVLSRGMPFIDTAWLSQVVGYATYQTWGVAGLQGLAGIVIAATAALLFHRLLVRTRSPLIAWLGVATLLWLNVANFAVMRPQLAGLFCFVFVWHRLTSRHPRWWDQLLIPAVFVLWANLHGSFVLGLAVMAMFLVGRAIDVFRRTGRLKAVARDASVRRLLIGCQLAAMATLINPYGLGLYGEVLSIAGHPNLQSLTEWQPLFVRQPHGWVFLGSVALLMFLYRWTPRRVATWEPLLLFSLGIATLWSARFGLWWAPVAAYLIGLHLHATCRRWLPWRSTLTESPRSGKWSVVSVGLVWIFFAYSPLGMRMLHHREPVAEKALSPMTPLGVVSWLNEHPPQGLVFNPYEWGDYLQWAGPADMQIFLNSHAHLVPRDVWSHYIQVVEQSSEWSEILSRYGINTVVLDKEYRERLIRQLKDDPAWKVGYEDNRGAVFLRRQPI